MSAKKFYITTAIPSTSSRPHIGNYYDHVCADAIARYKRMQGYDVDFCTGTDEHGEKIESYAKKAGVAPKAYVDGLADVIRKGCDVLRISYDRFIRTTDDYHETAVQKIFTKLYNQGDIYLGTYEGYYCTPCEEHLTQTQLDDGKCPLCGREVHILKEDGYFLRLSKYQEWIENLFAENPDFLLPKSRMNEMMNSIIKSGVLDICISRTSVKWGIPVREAPDHVIWIWIDALSNYITALGYNTEENSDDYRKYWPADLHVIGKDIARFHAIYWPIMLHALGEPIPKQILAHPWVLFGESKMSKTTGNVIYAEDLAQEIGVDAVRYYLLATTPYAQDGSITQKQVYELYNADLANTLGNLVNRTLAMCNKYFGGVKPAPGSIEAVDADLFAVRDETVKLFNAKMDAYLLQEAMSAVRELAKRANKYIDETTPWAIAKDETLKQTRLTTVINHLLSVIDTLADLYTPAMPETAEKIKAQLGADKVTEKPEPLFARLTV
jgi:methionyl-tRNA synthetase